MNVSSQCILGHLLTPPQSWSTDDIDIDSATFVDPTLYDPFTTRSIGENLAYSSEEPSSDIITDLTNAWIDEGHYYGYGTYNGNEQCTTPNTNSCGHFTQVQYIVIINVSVSIFLL